MKGILTRLENDLYARGRNKETINTFLSIAQTFLTKTKNKKPTISDVNSFLAGLRKTKKSDNYIRYNYYAIRRLLRVMEISIDLAPPPIRDENVNQPLFSFEEVKKIVTNAKVFCNQQEKAFLATSTTWGLRREEIVRIRKEAIKDGTILIPTRKKGITRETTIPLQIKKYIHDYDWQDVVSKSRASSMFYQILYRCKFNVDELPPHSGWHNFRRSLITGLMRTGVKEGLIMNFIRWKESGKSMLYRYTHIPPAEIDQEIYKVHPFLSLW